MQGLVPFNGPLPSTLGYPLNHSGHNAHISSIFFQTFALAVVIGACLGSAVDSLQADRDVFHAYETG